MYLGTSLLLGLLLIDCAYSFESAILEVCLWSRSLCPKSGCHVGYKVAGSSPYSSAVASLLVHSLVCAS